jgi:predicted metalloprotease
MKWEGQRQSDNVEDRRGDGGGGLGGGGPRIGGRGIGIGSIVIALAAGWIFGINPLTVLGILSGGGGPEVVAQQPQSGPAPKPPAQDKQAAFVSTVLADTEDVWTAIFRAGNAQYQAPKLVLFRGATRTACGLGESAMGPFYCPGDRKVYLDMDFFDTLRSRLGAPGDFAQAYVVAHEIGHHVQNLLGITDKADAARRTSRANEMSVRVELQADCLAGVWAHHSQRGKGWLEQGDLEEAMNAATQIGDDTLQRKAQGHVVPESFTHGSSQQRVRWFQRGAQSGDPGQCNALESREL